MKTPKELQGRDGRVDQRDNLTPVERWSKKSCPRTRRHRNERQPATIRHERGTRAKKDTARHSQPVQLGANAPLAPPLPLPLPLVGSPRWSSSRLRPARARCHVGRRKSTAACRCMRTRLKSINHAHARASRADMQCTDIPTAEAGGLCSQATKDHAREAQSVHVRKEAVNGASEEREEEVVSWHT